MARSGMVRVHHVAPTHSTWGAVVDLVPNAKGEPLVVGLEGGVWRLTPAGN